MARVIESIEEINEKQRLLNEDYDEVQKLKDPTKALKRFFSDK